jgi:hypothetical protein
MSFNGPQIYIVMALGYIVKWPSIDSKSYSLFSPSRITEEINDGRFGVGSRLRVP